MKPPTAIRAICGRALPMEAEPPVATSPATTTAIIKERMAAMRQNDSFRLRRLRSAIISGSSAMNFLQSGPVLPNSRSTIQCRGRGPAARRATYPRLPLRRKRRGMKSECRSRGVGRFRAAWAHEKPRAAKPRGSISFRSADEPRTNLFRVAGLQSRAQDVAERSTGIGRTILVHRFLLFGHLERLDRQRDAARLAVEHGDAGIHLLAGGEPIGPLIAAVAGKLGAADEGGQVGVDDLHLQAGI